jgi:hypothetical protein
MQIVMSLVEIATGMLCSRPSMIAVTRRGSDVVFSANRRLPCCFVIYIYIYSHVHTCQQDNGFKSNVSGET